MSMKWVAIILALILAGAYGISLASVTMDMVWLIGWHCPARCRAWRVWNDQKWWRTWCHACAEWGE